MKQLKLWPAKVCEDSLLGKLQDMGMPESMVDVFTTMILGDTDWWNIMYKHPTPCIHEVALRWSAHGTAIQGPYVCIQCGEYVPEVWAKWAHDQTNDEELTVTLPQTTQSDSE